MTATLYSTLQLTDEEKTRPLENASELQVESKKCLNLTWAHPCFLLPKQIPDRHLQTSGYREYYHVLNIHVLQRKKVVSEFYHLRLHITHAVTVPY